MFWRKSIGSFEIIPKWYGATYKDFMSFSYVCHPIPINLVIALIRKIYSNIVMNKYLLATKYQEIYDKGFSEGYKRGREHNKTDGRVEFEKRWAKLEQEIKAKMEVKCGHGQKVLFYSWPC
jgi:hypothetical protein